MKIQGLIQLFAKATCVLLVNAFLLAADAANNTDNSETAPSVGLSHSPLPPSEKPDSNTEPAKGDNASCGCGKGKTTANRCSRSN